MQVERVGSYVQWMQVNTIIPVQEGILVQLVHSIRPSTAERMDNCLNAGTVGRFLACGRSAASDYGDLESRYALYSSGGQ